MSNNYTSQTVIHGTKAFYARPELVLRTVFVALLLFTYGMTRAQGQADRTITINSIGATAGCPGQLVAVNYTAIGNYNNQNRFVAQLVSAADAIISESSGLAALSGTLTLPIPTATAAGNYRIVVISTQLNNVFSADRAFRVQPVTQITTQPGNQVVGAFSPVTFSVVATGEALTYQWFRNNAVISGATAASYTLPVATAADAGTYTVQVTGVCETRLSSGATLTVTKRTPAFAAVSASPVISYNQAIAVSGKISTIVNGVERIPTGAVAVFANSASASVALGSAPIAGDGTFAASLPPNANLGASATPYALSFEYSGDPNFAAANDNGLQLVVNKATAQLLVGGLVQSYDGAPKEVTVTTVPAGLGTVAEYALPAGSRVDAGTYAYTVSLAPNPNYEASPVSGTFTVNKAIAKVTIVESTLSQVFDGQPKVVTVVTEPAELSGISVRYNGSPTPPINATDYTVDVALSNRNYEAAAQQRILRVSKATAILTIVESTLNQVFDGQPKAVTVVAEPADLSGISVRYNGSLTPPVNATDYTVDVTLFNRNYQAAPQRRVLRVSKAIATLTIVESTLNQVFDGQPKVVTVLTEPANLSGVSVRYNGSLTPPVNATDYTVDVTLFNRNYQAAPQRRVLRVSKAIATLTIVESTLNQVFDGQPKVVTVLTEPANLSGVSVRYNGNLTAPVNIGSYGIDVALFNNNYQAVALRQMLTVSAPTTAATQSTATRTSAARVGAETSPEAGQPAAFRLNAYPNPFADKITLNIGSEVAGDVAITVVDGKGRGVTRQVVQAAGQGSRTVEIDLSTQEAGLYLLNVQSGAKREVVKVFKSNR
jgi:hypothetical protein